MKYKAYKGEEVTRDVLNTVKVGDLVKINNWKRPFRVKGVSKDYFLMMQNMFGKMHYSVCEKKRYQSGKHNNMTNNKFHCGTDHWIFGSNVWLEYGDGSFQGDNVEAVKAYLKTFELPDNNVNKSKLSHRSSIPINEIYIKSDK